MSSHEFAGFDGDTVADFVRQPPLDALRSAARARRRRRISGVALALVLILASMAAVPLTGTYADRWANPGPVEETPVRGAQLVVTGPDSGVAVALIDDACRLQFVHTNDRGRSWTDWDVATYETSACQAGLTDPNGNPLPWHHILGERSYLVLDNDTVRLSTDYGRTWQNADQAMVTVSAFPPQSRVIFCEACIGVEDPLAVDPSTGTVYRLTGHPAASHSPSSIYPSADGTIWMTYRSEDVGAKFVARSADRGATWNTWQAAKGANVIAVAGVDAREAYLLVEPELSAGQTPEPDERSRLIGTTDGGVTWKDVGTDLPAAQMNRPFTVGADGSLLVGEWDERQTVGSTVWMSRDGGRHFTKAREHRRQGAGVAVAPGYAWAYEWSDPSAVRPDHVMVTRDGSSWTRFGLPD